MRTTLIATLILLLPLVLGAETFSADLSGAAVVPGPGDDDATGFAVVDISGTDVSYSIIASGLDTITAAHIHTGAAGASGGVVVDLEASFINGTATGSVAADAATLSNIIDSPEGFYVQVHTEGFPNGAIRGQLAGAGGGEGDAYVAYFPVAAAIAGQAGTFFRTDARMVNLSGQAASVTLQYYPEGDAGNSGPSATATVTVGPGQEAVLNDFVAEQFGVTDGKGAVVISSSTELKSLARIYNDARDAGLGTFGQLVPAQTIDHALTNGVLPFLSNEDAASGEGFRGNIGWFNPNTDAIQVSFAAWDATTGQQLGTLTSSAEGLAQQQLNLAQLWPELADAGDLYVTFVSSEPVFMYASVVDNVNGDAIFIPAVPAS